MLHVVDNLLPADLLEALRQLCVIHGQLKQTCLLYTSDAADED